MDEQMANKTFAVSGATSGIGLAVAEALARLGAHVIGIGRSAQRCREAEQRLRTLYPGPNIVYLTGDLALQSQVRRLAAEMRNALAERGADCLDGLVNNASTFTYWLALTEEGFETQWAVNHLAPFVLTHELLPLLQSAPAARIVTVSSASHRGARMNWQDIQLRRHYNGLSAYGQSKLANVLFTLELNRRLGEEGRARAFAADPGLVQTDIGLKGMPVWVRWIWKLRRAGGVSPQQAARGIVFLLTDPAIQQTTAIYWKNGLPVQADPRALDAHAAGRLWTLSAQMCAINL